MWSDSYRVLATWNRLVTSTLVMKNHVWREEEADGGPIGSCTFWVCANCGISGGPTEGIRFTGPLLSSVPLKEPTRIEIYKRKPNLYHPTLTLSEDCDETARLLAEAGANPRKDPSE